MTYKLWRKNLKHSVISSINIWQHVGSKAVFCDDCGAMIGLPQHYITQLVSKSNYVEAARNHLTTTGHSESHYIILPVPEGYDGTLQKLEMMMQ